VFSKRTSVNTTGVAEAVSVVVVLVVLVVVLVLAAVTLVVVAAVNASVRVGPLEETVAVEDCGSEPPPQADNADTHRRLDSTFAAVVCSGIFMAIFQGCFGVVACMHATF
jgi:hypothetical protein